MPKKADEELADPYERILRASIPPVSLFKAAGDPDWTDTTGINGWKLQSYTGGSLSACVYETTIDLSGYAHMQKTFFPQSAFLQRAPTMFLTAASDQVLFYATLITTVPLDLEATIIDVLTGSGPSLLTFTQTGTTSNDYIDWSQVLFFQSDIFYNNSTLSTSPLSSFMQLEATSQLGSLSATAADKLYCYVIAVPGGTDVTSLGLPALRVGMVGQMAEEPTTEYLMRQLNSYQLANQV